MTWKLARIADSFNLTLILKRKHKGFGLGPVEDAWLHILGRHVIIASQVVEAARSAGRRAIIARFWEGAAGPSERGDVFFIKGYPHLKLFPRMAAVIHHGGAGTTATSAASGVPQIVVPHVLDQYYWGHRVYTSRLGPKPIWRSRLSSRKLAEAIEECLTNDEIRKNAKQASKRVHRQESLDMTVREVLRTAGQGTNHPEDR